MAGACHQQEGSRKCGVVQDQTLVQGGLGIFGYQRAPCSRVGIVSVRHADAATRGLVVGDQQQIVVREEAPKSPAPRPADVLGVITKEHVADAVAAGIQAYPR